MLAAVFRQVEACDAAQLDTERLQKDGKQVGHEDDEQVTILRRGAGFDVGCIVARVDVGDGNEESRPHESHVLLQRDHNFVHEGGRRAEALEPSSSRRDLLTGRERTRVLLQRINLCCGGGFARRGRSRVVDGHHLYLLLIAGVVETRCIVASLFPQINNTIEVGSGR